MNLNIDFEELKNLDFNDVGGWPLGIKVVAVVLLCAATLFAGYWFHTRNQLVELGQVQEQEQELLETFTAKQHRAVNLEAYKAQMAEMERSYDTMLRQLPSETEVAELLVDVSQAGLANGLEFDLFKPGAEQPAEFYAELPISIKVTGTYHDFGSFVSDVAALPRIVTLHDITVVPGKGEAPLVMDATAKTYRYFGEDEQ